MITDEDLIRKGYKEYIGGTILSPTSTRHFQKKFVDASGIKYFVTFYEFENENPGYHWEVTSQFTYEYYTINVDMFAFHDEEITIEEIEEKYENIWLVTDAEYYERYDF